MFWNYISHDAHALCSVVEHHGKCSSKTSGLPSFTITDLRVYFKGALAGKNIEKHWHRGTNLSIFLLQPLNACRRERRRRSRRNGEIGSFICSQPLATGSFCSATEFGENSPVRGVRGALHGFLHRGPEGSSYATDLDIPT